MAQKQNNMAQNLFPNECKATIQLAEVKGKNESLGRRRESLRVMQNTYSPIRFYLTFPSDGSRNFDKILNVIK